MTMRKNAITKENPYIKAGVKGKVNFSRGKKVGNCMFYPENSDPCYRIVLSVKDIEVIG